MKKVIPIVLGIVIVIAIAVVVLMPKEFKIEITGEEMQKKAGDKFPQTIGKTIKLEMPKSSGGNDSDDPGFPPKPPGFPPKSPKKFKKPEIKMNPMFAKIRLENPQIKLTEDRMQLTIDIDITISEGYLFDFSASKVELKEDDKAKSIGDDVRDIFPSKYPVSAEATIQNSGKETWLIKSDGAEYYLVEEKGTVTAFGKTSIIGLNSRGYVKVSGKFNYKQEEQVLYFQDLKVLEVKFEKFAKKSKLPMDKIAEMIKGKVNENMKTQKIPVCDMKETAKEKKPKAVSIISKLFLKNISIANERLVIELSLTKK